MAAELAVVVDASVGRQKALRIARRLEPLDLPLSSPGGLVRYLGAVVEIAALPVLDTGQDLALGRAIAAELVGHDHARNILQALEQLAEEPFSSFGIAPALDQDVEHVAVLVHGAPKAKHLARDADQHTVELPFVARLRPAPLQCVGEQPAETAAMLFWALLASGQITVCKVNGWQTMGETLAAPVPVDLAP